MLEKSVPNSTRRPFYRCLSRGLAYKLLLQGSHRAAVSSAVPHYTHARNWTQRQLISLLVLIRASLEYVGRDALGTEEWNVHGTIHGWVTRSSGGILLHAPTLDQIE